MSAGRIPEAGHHRLKALEGAWTGEETLADTPWMTGGPAVSEVSAAMALGGFFLMQDYRQFRGGAETLSAHGLIGFDAGTGEYALSWFDSLGFPPAAPAGGRWDGDTLTVLRRSPRALARHRITLHGPDEYAHDIDTSWDDGTTWTPVVAGVYRRRAPAPPVQG